VAAQYDEVGTDLLGQSGDLMFWSSASQMAVLLGDVEVCCQTSKVGVGLLVDLLL
jgi:hypothetical protein